MPMNKVRFLMKETINGRDFSKGAVVDIDDEIQKNLAYLLSAKVVEKTGDEDLTESVSTRLIRHVPAIGTTGRADALIRNSVVVTEGEVKAL